MRTCFSRKTAFKSFSFLLGATAMISQIILLREYVAAFYGNEMVYALILAGWMFWVATGSFVASRFSFSTRRLQKLIPQCSLCLALLLPLTTLVVRSMKTILHIPPGEMMGLFSIALAAVVSLGPVTFILGSLFSLLSRLANNEDPQASSSPVYLWEAKGAVVAGALVTFALLPFLPNLGIIFIIAIVNLLVALLALFPRKVPGSVLGVVILSLVFFLPQGLLNRIELFSRRVQWQGFSVTANTDSVYGNITLLKLQEEYSLYENGLLTFSTGNDQVSEEQVHFALLAHPDPRHILLVGGGTGGGVEQALKYRDAQIDYVELDPRIVEVSQDNLPENLTQPLINERVNIFYTDGRLFIKTTPQRYDAVILCLPGPATALINRYYTQEFFGEVKRILTDQGILALSVSSSENYLSSEARSFLQSIQTTLASVFADVRSVPGDTQIFLACARTGVLSTDPKVFIERLKERQIKTSFVSAAYLPFKLSPDRREYIANVLKQPGRLNTDSRPVAYFYDIVLWSTHFNAGFKEIVEQVQGISGQKLLVLPLLILIAGLLFRKGSRNSAITLSIMATGFSGIIFQVVVILIFQTIYGYAYYKIGFIFTAFMLGLVLGSKFAQVIIRQASHRVREFYCAAQGGMVLYPLLLPLVFLFFREVLLSQQMLLLFLGIFAILPVVAGFLGGLQFPLAGYWISQNPSVKSSAAANRAGMLYGVDIFGAAVGAFLTGTFLIPLFGINAVAFLCAAINFMVLILLLLPRK